MPESKRFKFPFLSASQYHNQMVEKGKGDFGNILTQEKKLRTNNSIDSIEELID